MKVLFSMLLVLVLAMSGFAALGGPTTALTPSLPYEWEMDTVISNVALYDTTGSTTSDTLVVKRRFPQGYEFILVTGTLTGAQVAACSLAVRVDSYGKNDSLLTSVRVDSILASTDGRKLIRLANYPGLRHSIVLQGVGSNGAEVILNEIEIYKRRIVSIMKSW